MKKQFIITRDNNKGDIFRLNDLVTFWSDDSDVVNDIGCFHIEYCGGELVSIPKKEFKSLFGFTPRKGSKKLLTVDFKVE